MLRLHQAVTLMVLALLAACSAPAAPSPDSAVGRWRTEPEPVSPRGRTVGELTFTAEGRFASDVRSFALHVGQKPNELSGSSRTVGHYQIDGRRLQLQPDSLILFDTFSPEAGVVVITPYPYDRVPFDGATITVSDDRLTLNYLSYPADAPVPTERQFRRVND
jgi:hypothetical protein